MVYDYMPELLCYAAGQNASCGIKLRKGACPNDPSYFIFTFTRNPWDRAVSMWSYGLKKLQLKVKDFAVRKSIAAKYCTFDEFVNRLATNRLRPGCGAHVEVGQFPSIFTRKKTPGVHYVGRLEHFDRDFKTILQVNIRETLQCLPGAKYCKKYITVCYLKICCDQI